MCGIAGVFGARAEASTEAMVASMGHRGPDDHGIHAEDGVALGQARLAIIDLSPGGHQPMSTPDGGIWIVFNGEIYNYRQERAQLETGGYVFRSESDTEVVLALYQRYGDGFLSRLRGIFAIAIYDRRGGGGRERLLLARDQFGIKPLLYAKVGGALVFASELKAILSSGMVEREIDGEALRTLVTFGSVCQPRTLVKGVSMLPAAHRLVAERGGLRVERYWAFGVDRVSGLRRAPYRDIVRHVRDVLLESVSLQLVADVPVGAFLSGGVDSSLIVAMMARQIGTRVKTFSVGFERTAAEMDETEEAAEIAALLGTDHTRVHVGDEEAEAHLMRFVAGLDQPSVDGMNSYFVSHWTARSVKVALSGTGGDELFAGYPWFAGMVGMEGAPIPRSPSWAGRLLDRLRASPSRRPAAAPAEFLDAYGRLYHCFGPDGPARVIAADLPSQPRRHVPMHADLAGLDELPDAPVLDRVGALCLNGYTRNQLLRDIDACAMASSLEVRVPFLDPVVADTALSLPASAKLAPGGRPLEPGASYLESGVKRVVVDVAREFLPPEFFTRRGKRGFGMPFGAWMRGPLRETMEDCLSPGAVARRGLFDPSEADRIRSEFLADRLPWNHPWLLMVTELWCRNVLDGSSPALLPPVGARLPAPCASR